MTSSPGHGTSTRDLLKAKMKSIEGWGSYEAIACCRLCHHIGFVRSKGGGRPTLRGKVLRHWERVHSKQVLSVRVDPGSRELVLLVAIKSESSRVPGDICPVGKYP